MYVKRPTLNGRLFSFTTFASTENAEVRTGTAVGVLWTRQLTLVFHKAWTVSWLTMQLLASQEGLIKQTWTHDNTVARRLDWGNDLSRYSILRTITKKDKCRDHAESKRLLVHFFFISWIWGTVFRPRNLLATDWTAGVPFVAGTAIFIFVTKSRRGSAKMAQPWILCWHLEYGNHYHQIPTCLHF